MTLALLAITAVSLAVADHLTGTAFYQKDNTMFHDDDDRFDVFNFEDEDGSTGDYWDAYLATVGALPMGLVAGDDATIGFSILTDDELAEIDSEVDDWPAEDIDNADWLWFLSGGQTEEDGAYIED